MSDLLSERDLATLTQGRCPSCQKRGFVLGPKGGAAQNIECANVTCRARYNVTTFSGEVLIAEHIPREGEGGLAWPSAPDEGAYT